MRASLFALATSLIFLTAPPAEAQAAIGAPAASKVIPDANAPTGKLSDAAKPTAYWLDFAILPEAKTFSGHNEIDVTLKSKAKSLYLHGRDLTVSKAVAIVGGNAISATYTQVDATGTARLDFANPVPAGSATLVFDYTGAFADSGSARRAALAHRGVNAASEHDVALV